jgi:two-component sensor histidine kinase
MRTRWTEADRLAALRSYDVLDTPTEAAFRDFVQIAAHVCEAPIAVVNFVDERRQWFAAEQGFGIRETPLDVSICAHAILQPGVFVVPDLSEDERFDCNPLVTDEPRLRFYAGALLETPDALPLGTLCVLDYVPRPNGLTAPQTFTLEALARQVMTQLELRRALRQRSEVEAEKAALLAEKDLLVQEVHHRVKNSLSTVQSLLLLQSRTTTDDNVAQPLRESAARIQVFGTMHEHLYRIGAASHVEIATYLGSLLNDQQAAFASGPSPRTITLEADAAQWPSSEAPALGMIVVELVTNALKYGEGTVRVTFRTSADEAVLTVEDEGHGLPQDFDPTKSRGMGMRVVTGLLRTQGRGRLDIDRSRPGTTFVARLKPTLR